MSSKRSVARNYIYNLCYQIFQVLIPVLVTPYIARVLGENGTGQYSFCYSIVTYFSLFAAFGFNNYGQRLVAMHQGDRHRQSIDFWEIVLSRLLTTMLSLMLLYFLIFFNFFISKYNLLMLIFSINVIAVAFDVSFFFQGNENFKIVVIRNIVVRIAGLICIFLFVRKQGDLWKYTLIQCISLLLSNLTLWLYVPHEIEKVDIRDIHFRKHISAATMLFIPTIATSVYTTLDKTLIGVITKKDAENGNYHYAEKLIKLSMTSLTSLGTVLIPRNTKKFAECDFESINNNIYKSIRFIFMMGCPLMIGSICIADNIVPWFLGTSYAKVAMIIKILSPIILIIGLSNVFGMQYLIPSKQEKKYTIAIVSGAIINFLLNIFLIYFFMSYGAAIATVIAESMVTIIMYCFLKKDINLKSAVLQCKNYFLGSILMGIACYNFGRLLIPSLISTMLIIASGAIIYLSSLIFFRDSFLLEIISRLKMRDKNKNKNR